jgi:hypothetical protein
MASKAQNTIAPECPRNDRKTHGDGFGIPISVVFRDFETFFNKFLATTYFIAIAISTTQAQKQTELQHDQHNWQSA